MEDAASYLRKNYTNFKINDFYDKCGTIDQQQSEKIFKDAILKIINQPNESGWRDFAKNQHGRNYPALTCKNALEYWQSSRLSNIVQEEKGYHQNTQRLATQELEQTVKKQQKRSTTTSSSSNDENNDQVLLKKQKRNYSFSSPHMAPSVSLHKPRLLREEYIKLQPVYQIQINEDTKAIYREDSHPEYIMNMEEQSENKALNDLPNVMKFLTSALAQDIDDLPAWLWNNGRQNDFTEYEKQMIQVIRYVLTDYHANCKKPTLNNSNERTPFCEYVIPIFK